MNALYTFASISRSNKGSQILYFQGLKPLDPEDEGITILQNISNYPPKKKNSFHPKALHVADIELKVEG